MGKGILERMKQNKEDSSLWYTSEKRLYVLRTYSYQGENYIVFFKYRPSVFKTRGEYTTFNVKQTEDIQRFMKSSEDEGYELTFPKDEDGNPGITSRMPHIPLDETNSGYIQYMQGSNIKREVNDLLDVLDLVAEKHGLIYLDPTENLERMEGNGEFSLSDNPDDYERPIIEFVTSTEKSTLSYGFLLLGEEEVDKIKIERRKYFTYKIIDDEGNPCIDTLYFILPIMNIIDVQEYLTPYLKHDVEILPNERIKVTVDVNKLNLISTIHELPVTLDLIEEREQLRLLMKSNTKFRKLVKEIAKDSGVPIPERYSNMYNYDKGGKDKLVISCRTRYTNDQTRAGGNSLPKIMKEGNIDDKYIKELIKSYTSGRVGDEYILDNIERAKTYYKNELVSECFAGLFTGILGNPTLSDMYKNADTLAHGMEYYINSIKLKLKPFGRYQSPDVTNFIWRLNLGGVKQTGMIDNDSFYVNYEDVEIKYITEAKYE